MAAQVVESRVTTDRYRLLLESVVAANQNILRVNGDANVRCHSATSPFYRCPLTLLFAVHEGRVLRVG